nr:EOG090X0DEG [Lepidurus arcticus]
MFGFRARIAIDKPVTCLRRTGSKVVVPKKQRKNHTGSFQRGVILIGSCTVKPAFHAHHESLLNEAYLRSVVNGLAELPDPVQSYDYTEDLAQVNFDKHFLEEPDYDDAALSLQKQEFNLRDPEYMHHSSNQNQNQDTKTENVLPAYCNPPNPCPLGYTRGNDGCLEEFENTAAFSREYQAAQDCMCDTEHMFDCPASNTGPSRPSQTASNTIVDTAIRQIMSEMQDQNHKSLVAKKLFTEDHHDQVLGSFKARARKAATAARPVKPETNPYLQGEKLPIAAKKGITVM